MKAEETEEDADSGSMSKLVSPEKERKIVVEIREGIEGIDVDEDEDDDEENYDSY